MNILNKKASIDDEDDGVDSTENIYVTSYTTHGLKLSNNFTVFGPCILFPRTILSWNVASARDITPESLVLFSLLEPRLDCLVIGVGDGSIQPPNPPELIGYCRRLGINLEILNTEEACATFNFLNGERRHVAAAIVPPNNISLFNPEEFLHETMNAMGSEELLEAPNPSDMLHPMNWHRNPEGMLDEAPDRAMSMKMRYRPYDPNHALITKREAKEIRYTEKLIAEEIEAMEDRYTPEGRRATTELDLAARALVDKEIEEYEKTGVISPRLEAHLNMKEESYRSVDDMPPALEGLEQYQDSQWQGLERSKRMRKQFDKLYDVGQEDLDFEEEGRKLAEKEKMTLVGEREHEVGRVGLLEGAESGKWEEVKLLEEPNEGKQGDGSQPEKKE